MIEFKFYFLVDSVSHSNAFRSKQSDPDNLLVTKPIAVANLRNDSKPDNDKSYQKVAIKIIFKRNLVPQLSRQSKAEETFQKGTRKTHPRSLRRLFSNFQSQNRTNHSHVTLNSLRVGSRSSLCAHDDMNSK